MHKIEDLIVWKKAIQLTKEVYLLSAKIPNDERFGIISQVKR
jgi:four helix bundle protein